MTEMITCHRCPVVMVDDGEWFTCPCCRSRTRGLERQQARFDAHAAELGMTPDEYDEYMRAKAAEMINPEPLPPDMLKTMADRLASEWRPACEHDAVNPFLSTTA